jgi:hypothetical protein
VQPAYVYAAVSAVVLRSQHCNAWRQRALWVLTYSVLAASVAVMHTRFVALHA